MNSQTARRPESKRPTRPAKTKRYVKQTAHVEARRDGKPLIFGWGGHLSRNEKVQFQRRAIWSIIALISLILVSVLIGFWVNINIITPSLPITSVNGHNIPQSDYRKLLAVKAQLEANKLNGPHGLVAQSNDLQTQINAQQKSIDDTTKQIDSLNKQIQALPAGSSAKRTDLNNQLTAAKKTLNDAQTKKNTLNSQYQDLVKNAIPNQQVIYTQPQQESDSVSWLQDDELIREWLATQNSSVRVQIEPGSSAIDNAVKDFAANIPHTSSYSKFLSDNHLSDADVHAMMALKLRRDNAQTYQASLITSPTYQVLARTIAVSTPSDANNILQQLKNGADFGKLAKAKSVDNNTNSKGGSLGWLARGQYTQIYSSTPAAVVDNWLFDPSRKLNETSPALYENGIYHIVQILGIDPSRPLDSATLKSLKDNALTAWLLSLRANAKITPVDQSKQSDAANIPPGLPASAPGQATPGAGGLPPGSVPGGLPAGGAPSSGSVPGQP